MMIITPTVHPAKIALPMTTDPPWIVHFNLVFGLTYENKVETGYWCQVYDVLRDFDRTLWINKKEA